MQKSHKSKEAKRPCPCLASRKCSPAKMPAATGGIMASIPAFPPLSLLVRLRIAKKDAPMPNSILCVSSPGTSKTASTTAAPCSTRNQNSFLHLSRKR